MQIGDKVRVKESHLNGVMVYNKGTIGIIYDISFFDDTVYVDFETNKCKYSAPEFIMFLELIKSGPKIPVPATLRDWYNKTKPYVGGNNNG